MKRFILGVLALSAVSLSSVAQSGGKSSPSYNEGINIIPLPKELTQGTGEFVLSSSTRITYMGQDAKSIAEFFAPKMRRSTGYQLRLSAGKAGKGRISLAINPALNLKSEGYTLTSTPGGVAVVGKSAQGLFYGMQSLLQLLPAEIESTSRVDSVAWRIPAVSIKDEPAFAYRGQHLDVCRHWATVEEVKAHIDILAMFKINYMHWHLTEDQGWRIEIKKYPKLTEVGAKRIEYDGSVYGPFFYTQEQIKDMVKYAQERFVTIIPEIELPGHAMGAIAAYPELACFPKTQKGSDYAVRNIWGVEDDVFCPGKEHTFQFISDVIDEVAPLFPSEYFHIGGDECPKTRWKICPNCQKRIKDEGLKDEHELQSYTIRRAQELLAKHGKKLIGWDEILEGGLAPSATVMSWRGEKGGIESANAGHDVIMTPAEGGLYLDHYQGDPKVEPLAIFGYAPLSKTYSYYPIPEEISADKRHHILGAQANVWTENIYNDGLRQYRAYPRTFALAEAVWTPREKKSFEDFSRRLNNAQVRLDQTNVNYHIPIPEQPVHSLGYIAFTESALLDLKTTRPMTIVYTESKDLATLAEPTASSPVYRTPIVVTEDKHYRVACVLPSGKLGLSRTITFKKSALQPATVLENAEPGMLTKTSEGRYGSTQEFAGVTNWTDGKIVKLEEIRPNRLVNNLDEFPIKAVVAEGYIHIPKDGVYAFATNLEEFWLDGERIINNGGEVSKWSRHDTSRALKAGYHPIKAVFIGGVRGGFPSYWDDCRVHIRAFDEKEFKIVEPFIEAPKPQVVEEPAKKKGKKKRGK